METKCVAGREHGAFVDMTEPEFNPIMLDHELGEMVAQPQQYGYCSACGTAMRWDVSEQRLVDWPEANLTPHCETCSASIGVGVHHLCDVRIDIDTFLGPFPFDRPTIAPVVDRGVFCSPLCLMYFLLDNERLRDVFGR